MRLRERGATACTTRAQGACGLAAAADDLAEIGLGDLELVDVGLALLDELDADFVRLVDEVHRQIADQLRQIRFSSAMLTAAFGARASRATDDRGERAATAARRPRSTSGSAPGRA